MKNKDNFDIEKEIKEMPSWFNFLLYGGFIVSAIVVGILFGITASAIIIIAFSAFFSGYLAIAYTTSFEIGKFAKLISMALWLIGVIILFIFEGWWGFGGIFGYWLLMGLSMVFWRKHASFKIE